jgi:2-keto-4-pentenoate hydratase
MKSILADDTGFLYGRPPDQGTGVHVSEQTKAVAQAFVAARRDAQVLEAYPGPPPRDLLAAYSIQDQAIRLDGRPIAGWKVGRINPPDDARLGANRIAGPIFANTVFSPEAGETPDMPVFEPGFAAAEAEFLLHVAAGATRAMPRDDEETRRRIDEVRLGIEIASSPYPRINADGPAVTASDFGNNFGLVLGPRVPDWRAIDLSAVEVTTAIGGRIVGAGTAAAMLDGPFGAVRFLLANLAERGIDTSAGLWVSTGAITGVHPVHAGEAVTARFGGLGEVSCRIVAASHHGSRTAAA